LTIISINEYDDDGQVRSEVPSIIDGEAARWTSFIKSLDFSPTPSSIKYKYRLWKLCMSVYNVFGCYGVSINGMDGWMDGLYSHSVRPIVIYVTVRYLHQNVQKYCHRQQKQGRK